MSRQFLQGLITAKVAFAEISGALPMTGMSDQTFKLICDTSNRLNELIVAEVQKLDPERSDL